ncbi:MAG: BadF/BadG/BcrA/BcrD ATPase family protein [Microbacterium sp.]|uniref:BadF/BadG/BcrA/BcrD ATPase family protein n=1 Tax=Microbacterium sp. TaxID=51671 RepID=UPI0039E62A01
MTPSAPVASGLARDDGYELALDVGQSSTKVRVLRGGGIVRDAEAAGVRTDLPVLPQLAGTVTRIAAEIGTITRVSAGVSGLTDPDAERLRELTAAAGVREVLLTHDSVTAFLGALGGQDGTVVAAGTGVVVMAVAGHAVARVDGWGHVMGDGGSAFWLGRAGLEAAMRSFDGRGPRSELETALRAWWPRPETAYIDLQRDPEWVRRVAAFAAQVDAAAETDEVASGLCRAAAARLAESVVTASRRVAGEAPAPVVSAVGGLFRSARTRAQFAQDVLATLPRAVIREPQGDGAAGAVTLLALPDRHPLRAQASHARR